MIRRFLLAALMSLSVISTVRAELGPQLTIGKQALQLNGAGVRTKTLVQIYESGLYLLKPTRDARLVMAADELMAIRVRITSGFVSRASLVSSLEEGLARSGRGNPDAFKKEIEQLQQILRDEVKKNDVYDFVYVPARGLNVLKNGKVQGVIPGLEFKQAFYGIWLSETPVDKGLRQAMLSGKSGSY